jgi:hypothetical protein
MKCRSCEQKAHPLYGERCEDCWVGQPLLTGCTTLREQVRGNRSNRSYGIRIFRKPLENEDQSYGDFVPCFPWTG